jgi:hypothetical protein
MTTYKQRKKQTTTAEDIDDDDSNDDSDGPSQTSSSMATSFQAHHPQWKSHSIHVRKTPVIPQAFSSLPPRPDEGDDAELKEQYALFALANFMSDRHTILTDTSSTHSLWSLYQQWLSSTDRWDRIGRIVLDNIDSQVKVISSSYFLQT